MIDKKDWTKSKKTCPMPEEWVIHISGDISYLWDDIEGKYVIYILGKGIVDKFYKVIIDENSDHYLEVIRRINIAQFYPELLKQRHISKRIRKPKIKSNYKREPYKESLKEFTIICKGCSREITVKAMRRPKYCKEACRKKHWRDKKRHKDAEKGQ
jgi:hypothetical protein